MPRNRFIPLVLLCLIILAAGCYTSRITIGVLEPATIKLPASIKRLSILPLPGALPKPGVFDSLFYIKPKPDTRIKDVKMGYLHGIYDVFSVSPRFQKVVISDSASSSFTDKGYLYWDEMAKLCTHDTTDVVLVLTRATSRDFSDFFYLMNGLQYYANDYTLLNYTKWIFYQPGEQRQVAKFNFTDTIVIRGGFSDLEFEHLLYEACYSTGERVGNRLVPHWKDASRVYFTGPGSEMRKAAAFIYNNQWSDAALIWNKVAETSKEKPASRAAHNLALAYERDDVLNQALLWIAYADTLYADENTASYKKILEDRMKIREKLDEQLNAE